MFGCGEFDTEGERLDYSEFYTERVENLGCSEFYAKGGKFW